MRDLGASKTNKLGQRILEWLPLLFALRTAEVGELGGGEIVQKEN